MLPLSGSTFPASSEQLRRALAEGLTAQGLPPRAVEVQSAAWPALELLRLDFTDVSVAPNLRLPVSDGPAASGLEAARFELTAQPLFFENVPLHLDLHAERARFAFSLAGAKPALSLVEAGEGSLSLEIARTSLETLLQTLAAAAGVDVKKTRLELTSLGPRALSFRAEVTAKMFVATAAVTLSGELAVNDQLEARLSQLRFGGDGMIAKVAGGFIRPHLEKLEGRNFPLLAFSLGSTKLRDLQLAAGDTLRLTAQFGS